MKMKELYGILVICMLLLSSCLGDTNTQITVGEQEAVYQSRPHQGFYVNGGRFLYGSGVTADGDTGDCFLIEYSFDSADPALQGSDSLSVKLTYQPVSVPLWPSDNRLTDTTRVLVDEVLTESLLGRKAYIGGRLFLWSKHREVEFQQDSFMLSYDPDNRYTLEEGKRIYNLYLRAVKKTTGPGEEVEDVNGKAQDVLKVNAFNIEEFFAKAKEMEAEKGANEVAIAINYASSFNKDTTVCLWNRTEPMVISWAGSVE